MSRLKRDYDESIFQESSKSKKKIEDVEECGDGCGPKSGPSVTFSTESAKKSKKKRDTDVIDDVEECGDGCGSKGGKSITFGTESCKGGRKKSKKLDVVDDVEECGDGCGSKVGYARESADTEAPGDVDTGNDNSGDDSSFDAGSDIGTTTESAKSKKKKKQDTDLDLDDECDDEECEDDDVDEFDEDIDEKPKKKSKSKKKSKKDTDVDLDDEGDDDFGDDDIDMDTDDEDVDEEPKKKSKSKSKKKDDDEDSDDDIDAFDESASSFSPKPNIIEHDDRWTKEYSLESYLGQISEDRLTTERQIMTHMIDDLYKEYLMQDFYDEDIFIESEEEPIEEEDEVVQERFFGGTGKTAAGVVKPVAKGAKRILDYKNGVPRKGIIRNVVHRTKKDLRKGGVLYKLVSWPFLVIKNLVQTLYHKTKSFIAYKGLLLGIEVKINREISKIRKKARNLPKMALAGGAGYATAALASVAKGEPLPLKPVDFIASEGAKLVEELGRDTMLRALTSRLADAVEESPEKIRAAIQQGKNKVGKVTPEMGKNSKPVITMNQNKITMEGLVNMSGINKMLDDIDDWAEIAEGVALGVRGGDESCVSGYLSKMKEMEHAYMPDGKLNLGIIFNAKSGAVKIADFYEELASKLTEKTKKLEKGLEKITGLENAVKEGNISIASDTEKTLAELNTSVQHTCNAFVEMIDSIDDLGKYVMNTMNTYLGCLEQTSSALAGGGTKGRSDDGMSDGESDQEFKPKKKRHKLFGKKDLGEDDVDA